MDGDSSAQSESEVCGLLFLRLYVLPILFVIMSRCLKIYFFWDVTQCSLVERYQCFCLTCCLHLMEESGL
jgi:hypothetical protein